MFCATSATNSCARCFPHSACSEGMVITAPGTAETDTVCGWPSPGTSLACASPEACRTPASRTTHNVKPTVTPQASADARTRALGRNTPLRLEDASRPRLMGLPESSFSTVEPGADPGPSPSQPCLQGSADCPRKQCEPNHYLDLDGHCRACVSCAGDDLVEKAPCSWNSSRVCQCRPGMFCATSGTSSCARCVTCPVCAPGTGPGLQGVAGGDATSKPLPPGACPDCSTPESSKAPASTSPTLSPLEGSPTSRRPPISTSAPVSLSSTGKPILDPGPVLFWVAMVLAVALGSGSFLLCFRRACRARICQKLHLCYPTHTFRPKLERADSRSRRSLTRPGSDRSGTEPGTGALNVSSPWVEETCASVGAACPESLLLLDDSPPGGASPPRDPPEPRESTEHTNNRIEKIYIMKADTVIVGSVKTEVPEGRGTGGTVGPAGPGLEAELEVYHAPHYPEQETEPPLGSGGDIVMFSVEEEGKEDPWPRGK
ncbi:tumor necrosis factor receptor superfamily member 8 [Heterocephalus glaber]|uniref:Tumor necrosis factor receptor superfamily member 8 n=1 Tax=Heterocephalus glaber TaxID=10181 RepID=A0AAX6QKX5_HETGA|nr:tumor necrosis factor receptor superfamily member 8 [Heterocephalus glaber]XP_021099224.1 tumor necrosis factor receptor superfamily member 8 [Heterocephalus glaber]XP_021099225.1 tumor necrosis factor receptor superfamily member 8 [Heterocephalus glaber]